MNNSFEIKSTQLPLVALLLKSDHWEVVSADLLEQFGPQGENPDFFDNDPVVLDFTHCQREADYRNPQVLLDVLKLCKLVGVAFRGEPEHWTDALLRAGLICAPPEPVRPKMVATAVPEVHIQAQPQPPATEMVREVAGPTALVIDKPMRSGQKVYARGSDLIVLAIVNQGAEVVADGNIHVYAPLRGKAMAGARGNAQARIFSLCFEPELVSIAGVYRTSENPFPANVASLPAQVRLSNDGQEKLLFEPFKT